MIELARAIPNVDVLLALEPQELAGKMLAAMIAAPHSEFSPLNIAGEIWNADPMNPPYPRVKKDQIELAMMEAFAWLVTQGLLIPQYGNSHWHLLSRRAVDLKNDAAFSDYVAAKRLPKDQLHQRIGAVAWLSFMRGAYATAVFEAMREVEIAVREAAEFAQGEHGVPMIRRAFHKETGPLTDKYAEEAEKEALSALFAGAIGSYKNPHSHRRVPLDDPGEAAEIIMLASHLLRIVDARINLAEPS